MQEDPAVVTGLAATWFVYQNWSKELHTLANPRADIESVILVQGLLLVSSALAFSGDLNGTLRLFDKTKVAKRLGVVERERIENNIFLSEDDPPWFFRSKGAIMYSALAAGGIYLGWADILIYSTIVNTCMSISHELNMLELDIRIDRSN